MQATRRGTPSWDSRIRPWAEGSTKPLGHPGVPFTGPSDTSLTLAETTSARPSVLMAADPSSGETGPYGAKHRTAAMTESKAKWRAWLPAAAPGLLATPLPGLELCLSFLFLILTTPPTLVSFFFFFPNRILLSNPSCGFVRGQIAPVLNCCPHFATEAISDSLINHRLKASLPETAILIREMTMKPLVP